jgi:DNA-binding IclR family transcriptional regulator
MRRGDRLFELIQVLRRAQVLVGMSEYELMILHSVASTQALRVSPVAGNFLSLYATAGGKILLGNMTDQAITELLNPRLQQLTPKTPNFKQVLVDVAAARETGFTYDFDEHTMGVGAIAIGIQTPQGHYAIDVVGPVWRMEGAKEEIQTALLKCRDGLMDALRSIG